MSQSLKVSTRPEDLSDRAGVRIAPPHEHDGGRTHFELFVKSTGAVVFRSPSYSNLVFTIRGTDRRRSPRALAHERRVIAHGTRYFDVEGGQVVLK